jgi:iron complex outermembrane receptor protein
VHVLPWLWVLLGSFIACGDAAAAQEPPRPPSVLELKKLTVEELMALEVTSVSRTREPLGGAAAAAAIVTSEDIRRSGATTVPEALRMVPGLHVARQTSSIWVVASRGFSSVNSEKLLVLSDTRSIYTPLFSGVLWDVQDYLLQDIERIEVIRGPGATLWGSNAVNGVISIRTKSAKDTQGLYAETRLGTHEQAGLGARYGGRFTDRMYYRVFGKLFDRDGTFDANPTSPDDWRAGHAGFRMDWEANARDTLTVQSDLYRGTVGQLSPSIVVAGREGPQGRLRVGVGGGNVLARWRRTFSPETDLQLRVYYDRTHRDDPMFVDDLDTLDVDFQHRVSPAARHEVTWGGSYRLTSNHNESRIIFAVEPPVSRDQLFSGLVQDQIRLLDTLRVTVGTKVEHNDFSGFELQPSGRVSWQPSNRHAVWSAVSRAVRVPTRLERDIAIDVPIPSGPPAILLGNPAFDSEELVAYEAGYRWQPAAAISTDVAAFHNQYTGLTSLELGVPFIDPATGRPVLPLQNQNLTSGWGRGVEVLATYAPIPSSRFSASYTFLDMELDPEGQDLNRGELLEGATPRHQLGFRSSWDLPARFQVDGMFRHLSAIRRLPTSLTGDGVPGYSELDIRVAWLGWSEAELSLVAQNLLHAHHPEFGTPGSRGEIERGIYASLAWGF